MARRTDIVSTLPPEILEIVCEHLHPFDVLKCWAVTRQWNRCFKNHVPLKKLLLRYFGSARQLHQIQQSEIKQKKTSPREYIMLFQRVVSHYYRLQEGRPQFITSILKKPNEYSPIEGDIHFVYPVVPWHRWVQATEHAGRYDFPEPDWTYDDGLLVYFDACSKDYEVLDLTSGKSMPVGFRSRTAGMGQIIVRRLRLADKVLVIEFAKPADGEGLTTASSYRQFVVVYDLVPLSYHEGEARCSEWAILLRCIWELNTHKKRILLLQSRVFSCHSPRRWAAIAWYDDPATAHAHEECLLVYDIGKPMEICDCDFLLYTHSRAFHSGQSFVPSPLVDDRPGNRFSRLLKQGSRPILTDISFDSGLEDTLLLQEIESKLLRGYHVSPRSTNELGNPFEGRHRLRCIYFGTKSITLPRRPAIRAPFEGIGPWYNFPGRVSRFKPERFSVVHTWARRSFNICDCDSCKYVDLQIQLDSNDLWALTVRQQPLHETNDIILRVRYDWEEHLVQLDTHAAKKLQIRMPQGDERFIVGEDDEGIHILTFDDDGLEHYRRSKCLRTGVYDLSQRQHLMECHLSMSRAIS